MRFLASESEGKVWAMVVANIHEEWVDPNAIKAGLLWLWNVGFFRWSEWSYDVFFFNMQFQIFLGGPAKTSKDTKEMKMVKWPQPFLALKELLMYDSSCEKETSCENRTCELQFINVLELFFHVAFGNIWLFVSASREKRKGPDEFQVLPSRVTAGCQRHQKAFLHRISFFLKPGSESRMSAWCLSAQKNKRTQSHPGFFFFKNQTTKTAQRRRRHRLKKNHKALTSLVDFWTLPLDSRIVQKGRNCPESPESDWKKQAFWCEVFQGFTAWQRSPQQVKHGHDAGGLGWADPLEGRSAEDAGDGDNGWDGRKCWGFIYKNMGCPQKIDGIPCFSGQFFFLFPL